MHSGQSSWQLMAHNPNEAYGGSLSHMPCGRSSTLFKCLGCSCRVIESKTKLLHCKYQRLSPMILHNLGASDFLASTPTMFVVASLLVFAASIAVAVSFLSDNSDIPTYPVKSTWLQRKRQFRINGVKVIEKGFAEVTMSIKASR